MPHTNGMSESEEPQIQDVMTILEGYRATCLIIAGVKIGLFEGLSNGPVALDILAGQLGADPHSLLRFARGLMAHGLLEIDDITVKLTANGRLLVEGQSILPTWAMMIQEEYLPVWSSLHQSVLSGAPCFDNVFGMNVWEHRRQHPDVSQAFNQSMSVIQKELLDSFLENYDLSGVHLILDVGGGSGDWLLGILRAYPQAHGVLFDQEHVIEDVSRILSKNLEGERLRFVGGSFLDSVPDGGDVLMIKYCLHNWSDTDCHRILVNCRQSMQAHSRLLVIENMYPGSVTSKDAKPIMTDLHMMAVLGGKERTFAEYEKLGEGAGLRLERRFETRLGGPSILEYRRVR
jgi:O-methyltransferase domain